MNLQISNSEIKMVKVCLIIRSEEGGGALFGGNGDGGTNGDASGANGNSTEQLFTFR